MLPSRGVGWKYDLPPNDTAPTQREVSLASNLKINRAGRIFIEFSRSSVSARGISFFGGLIILIYTMTFIVPDIVTSLLHDWQSGIEITTIGIMLVTLSTWAFFPLFRMDLRLPRDEPIRFNRARQKVYFYEYRFDRLHPFGSKGWGVKPVAYDWADLTAEVYRVYAPMGYGGLIENVMISVRKTDTEEVIDRLFLCDDIEQGKQYWALARLYMQSGYDALPDSLLPFQGQKIGNGLNPMQYLAPRVRWPAKIDLESRSAPTTDEVV
ncbi:hypothetical protein QN085_10050 [Pseudomonas sp. M2(2023)]|uniref:DUF6708 domain-containing protein n=1 Tax=Pseudomonas sp. M2(2023) TaxID=3049084 RepID=UPI0025566DB5|nr:DUF6708 domain-containing protein [Pseudomonas sp. M2(2023)]WIV25906.1 hypothetical protein QN085_10050 [Pseudomonas sp. M2(2023)]